jgi:hypothetical protein
MNEIGAAVRLALALLLTLGALAKQYDEARAQSATPKVTTPPRPSEAARFAQDVLHSLASASDALKGIRDAANQPVKLADNPAFVATTAYRRASGKLRSAASRLEPYSKSSQKLIVDTAEATRAVYANLAKAFEESARIWEAVADLRPGESREKLKSESIKNAAEADEAWKLLPIASAARLSHALLDRERTTFDGKVGYLRITKGERTDLLATIESLFGEEIAKGKVTGAYPTEDAAGMFARFLRQPWRGSDER